jgi:hypothetical protein
MGDCIYISARRRKFQSGISLVATALMLILLGMFTIVGISMYKSWQEYNLSAQTGEDLDKIQAALDQYYRENGRYPCPASLKAPPDSAGFGAEVSNNCAGGNFDGTWEAPGTGSRMVRTGAVPVRTLGLPDSVMFDPYKKRYIYAVTEAYAIQGTPAPSDQGAITIQDSNGNNATAAAGNIVQTVYSMGLDDNGAYSMSGALLQTCNPAAKSGQNCDYATNTVFMNTLMKSYNNSAMVTSKIAYANPPVLPATTACSSSSKIKDVAFLLDTSGSMAEDQSSSFCPPGAPTCKRMDVARWAVRRALPARLYVNQQGPQPGKTLFTGFVGYSMSDITSNLTELDDNDLLVLDNPSMTGYIPPKFDSAFYSKLEQVISMCPYGDTPLGNHMRALADRLGNGDSPQRINKIMIISDGRSNKGEDPIDTANYIKTTYPNFQVDVIDMMGNTILAQIASITGGKYYSAENTTEFLQALYESAGLCVSLPPLAPPTDVAGCSNASSFWGGVRVIIDPPAPTYECDSTGNCGPPSSGLGG